MYLCNITNYLIYKYNFIGIRDLAIQHKHISTILEPAVYIYRNPDEYRIDISGGENEKPICFVKPMATCDEAPVNTAPQPADFYGVAAMLSNLSTPPPLLSYSAPLRSPPSPLPTLSTITSPNTPANTPQTSPTRRAAPRTRSLMNRRRRANPFNSNPRFTINQGSPVLNQIQYRYISEETRSEASEADESMDVGSDDTDHEFNFDPQY